MCEGIPEEEVPADVVRLDADRSREDAESRIYGWSWKERARRVEYADVPADEVPRDAVRVDAEYRNEDAAHFEGEREGREKKRKIGKRQDQRALPFLLPLFSLYLPS